MENHMLRLKVLVSSEYTFFEKKNLMQVNFVGTSVKEKKKYFPGNFDFPHNIYLC